jgi:hypothetical protein
VDCCRGLANKDTFSKSDPCCVVQEKASDGRWREIGRTEVIDNNLNPTFKKKIEMTYYFEKKQELKFIIYDWYLSPLEPPASRVPFSLKRT